MEEIKNYTCPECGKEMERGYVVTNREIRWATNVEEGAIFLPEAQKLTDTGLFSFPRVSALRCKFCRLVLFRY